MKILFVNAPVIRSKNSSPKNDFKVDYLEGGIRYGVRAGSRWPWTMPVPFRSPHYPFIMGYSASYIKSHGYHVNIIDAVGDEEYSYQRFVKEVESENADIVLIECSTPTIDIDLWIAEKVSKFAKVALAGPHLTENAEQIKSAYPFISFLLKGEYIKSSLKMVQTQKSGIYESEIVTDLDSIPFPYRDYRAAVKYFDPTMPTAKPQLQIYGSKGCPFKCTFCAWPQTMYAGNVALRKPVMIAEEIRKAIQLNGYRSIFFDDDTFNIGTERISELCDELKKIGLPWTMMGRLDVSPNWLYDKMVDSGCVGMRFGIETFNHEVLKRVKKGIERVDFKSTLQYISDKYPSIYIHLTLMKDLPGQSDEIHQLDMKILKDMGYTPDGKYRNYQLSSCSPFPGTELYREMVEKNGKDSLSDYKLYDGGQETIMRKLSNK